MHTARIREALADALAGRQLLTHPFYRRWEAGTLAEGELAAYAEQYRLIERALPTTLEDIAEGLPEGGARTLVESNLADELGVPAPHAVLFESFAQAAGAAPDAPPTPATDVPSRCGASGRDSRPCCRARHGGGLRSAGG